MTTTPKTAARETITEIFNIREGGEFQYDVYIGRHSQSPNAHYGNLFSHIPRVFGTVLVKTRDIAVSKYRNWLLAPRGTLTYAVTRREWILRHMHELRGKSVGCFCAPLACHGDVLQELLRDYSDTDLLNLI